MTDENIVTSDPGQVMELIDKLDGFKRFMLVLPIELGFVALVLVLAYRGQVTEAIAAITGIFGTMVGYYFGTQSQAKT
jgi:hypothetical protein